MYLSRIEWKGSRNSGSGQVGEVWRKMAAGYGVHEIVWSWFGDAPDRKRDFLYRQEGDGAATRFFTLSERPPEDKLGLWQVDRKPFAPMLNAGDRLRFTLRANPTKRIAVGKDGGKRCDVIMDAKRRLVPGDRAQLVESELVQNAGFEWLASRAERHGFRVAPEEVRVDGYRQWQLKKREEREVKYSTVEIEGILTVTEADAFQQTLREGLGSSKGFGCGLLLVKRL